MVKVANPSVDLKRGVDHIGVTVCFVVHDGKGSVLLQKRSQRCRDERGTWDIGGGAIEFGETIEEAIYREVEEELCTKPTDTEFLTAFDAHRNNEGTRTHWIAIGYAVKIDPKMVKIGEPEKIDEIGWFTSNELPSPLHSQMMKNLSKAIERGIIN